jgi:hypothetical protein
MNKPNNLKPFDLTKALAGEPVITRSGKEVTDLHLFNIREDYRPLYGVVDKEVESFTKQGEYLDGEESELDLFMAPETVKYYVHVYKDEKKHLMSSNLTVFDWEKYRWRSILCELVKTFELDVEI